MLLSLFCVFLLTFIVFPGIIFKETLNFETLPQFKPALLRELPALLRAHPALLRAHPSSLRAHPTNAKSHDDDGDEIVTVFHVEITI